MNKKYVAHTIDERHSEMLDYFHNNENIIIPQLRVEISDLKLKIKKSSTNHKIEEKMEFTDKLIQLKKDLYVLRNKKKKYLLENSKYIFNYFEEKKDISVGGGKVNVNVLNNFFKINVNDSEFADVISKKYSASKNIYRNYWKNVNNEISNIQDFVHHSDVCQSCHKGELIPQDEEGILICNNRKCGVFITYIIDSSKPTNKEPPNEVSYTAYIRLNHFKEILSQLIISVIVPFPMFMILIFLNSSLSLSSIEKSNIPSNFSIANSSKSNDLSCKYASMIFSLDLFIDANSPPLLKNFSAGLVMLRYS